MVKFNKSKASDQQDIIYALLSISSNACNNNSLRADYTKHAQQVIYNTALFLFSLTNTRYYTILEFLRNFTPLNTASLSKVAKLENARNVADFLKRQGGDVKIIKEVVKAGAQNIESRKEVMALLLKQRRDEVKVTKEVVKATAGNWKSGEEVIALLLR